MNPDENVTTDYTNLSHVLSAIVDERSRQSLHWHAAHDYGHSMIEWAGIVAKYSGRAVEASSPEIAQENWIKVAAVAVAAIQAIGLWEYGPNPATALNALAARLSPQHSEADSPQEQAAQGEE